MAEVAYELRMLEHLSKAGWPLPTPLVEPVRSAGSIWCLFDYLDVDRDRSLRFHNG
jgi:hypothetical protein